MRVFLLSLLFLYFISCPVLYGQKETSRGILVLAHGAHGHEGIPLWNQQVMEVVEPLHKSYKIEVAFGMAEVETIQQAVARLEERGVREIVAVPLFISSHSPIITATRRILGLDPNFPSRGIETSAFFSMTGALDTSPLVAEIVLDRARELSKEPSREVVVLVGHGPNEPEYNELWLRDMRDIADYVKKEGGFKDALVTTVRDDAPEEVRREATRVLREMVEKASRDSQVLIIPYLLASGGIEKGIEERLEGLKFRFGRPLLPHPNITRWIEESAAPYLR
jgi:sirohydrochlorin ferrochelatase